MNNLELIEIKENTFSLTINSPKNLILKNYKSQNIKLKILDPNVSIFYISKNINKTNLFIECQSKSFLKLNGIIINSANNLEVEINLNGDRAQIVSNFLVFAKENKQKIEYKINHLAPETSADINNYLLAFEKGEINFITEGFIKEKIINCNIKQLTKGIIFAGNALISAKPILLIGNNDVKAYHGSAIGKFNEEELFYLMSRGMNKKEAIKLILQGLITPILEGLDDSTEKIKILEDINNYF